MAKLVNIERKVGGALIRWAEKEEKVPKINNKGENKWKKKTKGKKKAHGNGKIQF